MIRKTIIAMFTLATVVTTSASILSYTYWPGSWRYVDQARGIEIRHGVTRYWRVEKVGQYSDYPSVSKGRLYGPYQIRLSLWMCVAVFTGGAVGAARIPTTLRRRHRRTHGLCLDCGYDLTGNVSGVCPECGTKVDSP